MSESPHFESAFTAETEPELRLEERALTKIGYGHCLDTEIAVGSTTVSGRNFLDAYGDSPHRQNTENMLLALELLDQSDPDYAQLRDYILHFLRPQFGEPMPETTSTT